MRRFIICAFVLLLLPRSDASSPPDRALIVVDHPAPGAPGTAAYLLDAGVVVLRDLGTSLVVLASRRDIETIERLDLEYRILDASPAGKSFYVVAPRSSRPGEIAPARTPGAEIIEATPEEAARLAGEGADIGRLFMTPMRVPRSNEPPPRTTPAEPDPVVEAMVDSVSIDRISADVQRMQDFVNRYSAGDSVRSARDWLLARFRSLGIDSVALQEFDPAQAENVYAVKPGVGHPEKVVIIGGHYDSIAPGGDVAPGADDNASGTACVLECARILSQYDFDYTIVFIAFSGEELGLLGSEAFAARADANGEDVVAMINVDMIGYLAGGDAMDLDVIVDNRSTWLGDLLKGVAAMYVPELPTIDGSLPPGNNSDHVPFGRHGFDAVMVWEDSDNHSPYIHTANDLVGVSYNNPTLAERSVGIVVATLATLAERFRVVIQHEPLANSEDVDSSHVVAANVLHDGPLDPDGLLVHYTVQEIGGDVTGWTVPLVYTGAGDAYKAVIPPQSGGSVVDYYIVAQHADGFRALDPKNAPDETHRFVIGVPDVIVVDDFSTDTGWIIGGPDDTAFSGLWVREAPVLSYYYDEPVQPGEDHTPDPDSVCFVTGNMPRPASHSFRDVDGGKTTLLSPEFDLSEYSNAWVVYYRWYSNDTGGNVDDEWVVDVSNDGGSTWKRLETLAESEREWVKVERNLADFISLTQTVSFRFVADDSGEASVVEALIDDFKLITYQGPTPTPPAPGVTLHQNVPNPFNPGTTIRFEVVPPASATLRVYDVAGRLVATLVENEVVSGERTVRWNGRNRSGNAVASGVYFYRLDTAGNKALTRKMVLVR